MEKILNIIREKKFLRVLLIIGLVLLQSGIYFVFRGESYAHWIIYVFPPTRIIDYLLGTICAFIVIDFNSIHKRYKEKFVSIILAFITLVILILAVLSFSTKDEIYSVACWVLPVMILIPCIVLAGSWSKVVNTILGNRAIVFLGNISFECFLLHQLVIRYGDRIWNKMGLLDINTKYIIYLALVIAVAYGYKKVEERSV